MSTQYELHLSLNVVPLDQHGGFAYGQGLKVEEQIKLGKMGFFELAAVIGRFNELSEIVKRERASTPLPGAHIRLVRMDALAPGMFIALDQNYIPFASIEEFRAAEDPKADRLRVIWSGLDADGVAFYQNGTDKWTWEEGRSYVVGVNP